MHVKLGKDSAILSDVLPYETPITFSNRFFYKFIVKNKVSFKNGSLLWDKESGPEIDALVFMIFGISDKSKREVVETEGKKMVRDCQDMVTIPFSYGISHKENSFRWLSVLHPRNQIQVIDFYEKYKELIIYYSNVSEFSLRSPARLAKVKRFDDERKTVPLVLSKDQDDEIGAYGNSLRSFFIYNKTNNIHQFFESKDYHICEKNYEKMAQLDVSKCFSSTYTHSIAWAILGKGIVKNKFATGGGKALLRRTFPGDFDALMQNQNYGETNGIVIGPELSRIFSEIIFQRVDFNLKDKLAKEQLFHKDQYSIFRYVDDYFVFYNDEAVFRKIVSELEYCLNDYKLSLNTEKELVYCKPIITELTIAKQKISSLLSDRIRYDINIAVEKDGKISRTDKFLVSSKPLITLFKIILKETKVDYKSVVGYSFSIVESRLSVVLSQYKDSDKLNSERDYWKILYSLVSILEFCFFIYAVSPRVSTTIKLCRVLNLVIEFSKSSYVLVDDMHHIFKKISDNVAFVVAKFEAKQAAQVETLYLLTVLSVLGKDYWLSEKALLKYFGGKYVPAKKSIVFFNTLNYFSISVLLFYIKDKARYEVIRESVKKLILSRIDQNGDLLHKDSESLLLALDCLACPYLEDGFKRKVLKLYGVGGDKLQTQVIGSQANWFTKWYGFEFGRELDAKRGQEVY